MSTDDLDQRLRDYAERWRSRQPPLDPTLVIASHPEAGPARPRRLPVRLVVLAPAAAAALVVAALVLVSWGDQDGQRVVAGSRTTTTEASERIAPWIDAPAPPPVPTTTTTTTLPIVTAPPCQAGDLTVVDVEVGGAMSKTSNGIRFRNAGRVACSVSGYPRGLSGTLAGRHVRIHTEQGTFFPDPRPGDLAPGDDGIVVVQTATACPEFDWDGPLYRDLSVEVPGGGSLPVPAVELNGSCGVRVGPLGLADAPRLGEEPPPPPPPPGSLASLAVRVETPSSVPAGEELRFVVTLSNPTSVPVELHPCPGYLAGFYPAGEKIEERRALNCAPVGSIPPSGKVRFEMRLRVPRQAEPGLGKLIWGMHDWGGPTGGAGVEVVAARPPG